MFETVNTPPRPAGCDCAYELLSDGKATLHHPKCALLNGRTTAVIGGCESGGEAWPPVNVSPPQGDVMYESRPRDVDPINNPPHYTFSSIEVIDAIEAWKLPFHLANVVKYIVRAPHKGNERTDLLKAQFYLNRYVERMK